MHCTNIFVHLHHQTAIGLFDNLHIMKVYNLSTSNTYELSASKIKTLKSEAKKAYELFVENGKLPIRKQKIVMPGVFTKEYNFHYKTNLLKNFNGFLLVNNSTKEHFYFN